MCLLDFTDDDDDEDFAPRGHRSVGEQRRGRGDPAGDPRRRLLPPRHPDMGQADHAESYDVRLVGRKRKPRQEISSCLKWIVFLSNFIVFLAGVTILSLGVYLCIKDPRGVSDWADVLLNPAIMLSIIGFVVCCVSMAGAVGALRDNIQLLKIFAMSVFMCYILLVVGTFSLFILFYSDNPVGVSAHAVLFYAVKRYQGNRNIADLVDYLQEQLECCGVSSLAAGYRDWTLSSQFNCSDANPYPERCGVPYSCCRRSVVSEAAGSANPLLPAMRSLECWQNALKKRPQDLEVDIHTRGCLLPLRSVFETHALHFGMIIALIIIPVCLSVCVANILARQIDHQKWLLEREARRNDRRRKRDRERVRMEQATVLNASIIRDVEAGNVPEAAKHKKSSSGEGPPKLPDTPPPDKPPAEYTAPRKTSRQQARPGHRAASSSPNRKISSSRPGPLPEVKKEKRQRSVPPRQPPSNKQDRTRHWVLQQSDFVNPRPTS